MRRRRIVSMGLSLSPWSDKNQIVTDTALSKIARIREELNRMFLERVDLIDGAIVAMLSANHVLIIGPPGTAKSMLADDLCGRIEGANYFQWLLTIINERIFHNGRERVAVPLITMFGASNELPDEDELTALYDRFMLRFMADYITEEHGFIRMMAGSAERSRTTLTFAELGELRAATAAVKVPGPILESIAQVRRELGREQIIVS